VECKNKVIPVIIAATDTMQKIPNIPGKHNIKEPQKTTTLGNAHILQKILI
jgi:hypothetical protein